MFIGIILLFTSRSRFSKYKDISAHNAYSTNYFIAKIILL